MGFSDAEMYAGKRERKMIKYHLYSGITIMVRFYLVLHEQITFNRVALYGIYSA